MKFDQKQHSREILSDPVATFSAWHEDPSEQEIRVLKKLSQQHQALKKQRKDIRTKTKVLSRKIGEAKRNGKSIDKLKASMQEHGAQLKIIANRLGNCEHRILDFFSPTNDDKITKSESAKISSKRVYVDFFDNPEKISVSLLKDELDAWNAYVSKNAATSIYHRAEWRELIRNTFGHQGFYFIARDINKCIVGILPLIRLRSHLFGDFMVSMPYFNYGGAIADHPMVEQKLINTANRHATELGVSHIEYRDDIARNDMPTRSEKVNMILAMPNNIDSLWKGFSSKLRSQIKRPQRENSEVKCGGEEYLEDFYCVFARNMRDLGTPVYHKSFFRNILRSFSKESRIMIIRLNGTPVSASFLVGHKDTLEIPWASTVREVNHLSMNMLLYWEVLKFAIENEFHYFDFGRSSRGSGTFLFKQQWGSQPKQLHWYYWLNRGHEIPSLNPNNPKYTLMINLWKRLPLTITKWLGPPIVKNLP